MPNAPRDPSQPRTASTPSLGEHKGHEIYPMPMFPILVCADVATTAAWYQEALGFDEVFAILDGPGPRMVHLRRRRLQDVMLVEGGPGPRIRFDADGELDDLVERATGASAQASSSVGEIEVTPWNTREVAVIDPDGHALVFGARHDNPEMHAQWAERFAQDRRA